MNIGVYQLEDNEQDLLTSESEVKELSYSAKKNEGSESAEHRISTNTRKDHQLSEATVNWWESG